MYDRLFGLLDDSSHLDQPSKCFFSHSTGFKIVGRAAVEFEI